MSTARKTTRTGEAFFRINRKSSALLIIDMQNAFLEPGAMLETPMGREIIARLSRLIMECRKMAVPVIWIRLDSSAPYGGLLLDKYPPLREQRVLFKGTHSYDLFSDLPAPLEDEFHVVKHKYDAFHRTDLDTLLRNIGADTVIITGVTTNCCCESTARSAFEHDYKVAFTSDGTAAFETRLHEATLGTVRELFGRVLTIEEVIRELGEPLPKPNIFGYATKELSQDAFICWLVACAAEDGGALQHCGLAFISALMKHGREKYGRLCVVTDVSQPKTQYKGIDVYFQARVDGSTVSFVIEDKTNSLMHSSQLERYSETVRRDDRPEDEFRLVYYKTGYIYPDERKRAEDAGYAVFAAEDMLRFLESQDAVKNHEILGQYHDHINGIVTARKGALAKWDWTHDFVQHEFMSRFRNALVGGREKWAKAIDEELEEWSEVTKGVNRGGGPWTQYWFCSTLFWRIDGYQPLRLRVWTDSVKKIFPGWTDNTWVEWMDTFQRLQREHKLAEAPFQRRMYSGNGLVQEGTVGAIALPNGEAEQSVPRLVKLHTAFLQEIARISNDAKQD